MTEPNRIERLSGLHNTNNIGPYTQDMRELVEAVLQWKDATRADMRRTEANLLRIAFKLPWDFTIHLEEELRKYGAPLERESGEAQPNA